LDPYACGHFGNPKRECRCSPVQVERYRQKISGPLLDRIDIHVEAPAVEYKELSATETAEPSATIRERVQRARAIQTERFCGSRTRANAQMTPAQLRKFCALDAECAGLIERAMTDLNFSARAYDRILKVARTIADLAEAERIAAPHLLEAIQYRTLDRTLWS